MRFPDFFKCAKRPIISFEIFPPKTEKALENLLQVIPELIELSPDYITVTYGAMGSTREKTLEIASLIKQHYNMETACHLTCVGASQREIDNILIRIYKAGIQNIVALRGDPPRGERNFNAPADGYSYAYQLVEHIRRFERTFIGQENFFGIAVAGYPEKHIEAPSLEEDILHLKRKVEAGADIVITQLFFNNEFYFNFVTKAKASNISVPIIPGLMPIVSVRQIKRITSMCGATIPPSLQEELEEAIDDDEKASEIGIRQCIKQARELLESGVPGLHFYVLNKSQHISRIMSAIKPYIYPRS
ncbi:MAG: methylenetetrahydrofolate reductase [Deltaproteobacteria bacterium]|jgi:methylenetetrahydrofolate reductase (NADPH)|nr:MAG: methylenetetrahydrofolate reductase [Deltaproteobacteria bacterium]